MIGPGSGPMQIPRYSPGQRTAEHHISIFMHLNRASGYTAHRVVIHNLPSCGRCVAEINKDPFTVILFGIPERGKQRGKKQTCYNDRCRS